MNVAWLQQRLTSEQAHNASLIQELAAAKRPETDLRIDAGRVAGGQATSNADAVSLLRISGPKPVGLLVAKLPVTLTPQTSGLMPVGLLVARLPATLTPLFFQEGAGHALNAQRRRRSSMRSRKKLIGFGESWSRRRIA